MVAVIDTGVRYDHPDLLPVAAGGNILQGYDMIADSISAGDGDGREHRERRHAHRDRLDPKRGSESPMLALLDLGRRVHRRLS